MNFRVLWNFCIFHCGHKRLCSIVNVQVLLELGRFAFIMLVRKLLVFNQEMITEYQLSDRAIQAGLLISNDTSLGSRQYRFYHLSIQEFLGALFVAQCVIQDVCHASMLVRRLADPHGHLSMFYRFLVALLPV